MRHLLALALLSLPAAALAEGPTIAEAAAISRAIEPALVERARNLFAETLRDSGVEVIGAGQKGTLRAAFVASLTLAEERGEIVLTGQVSRFHLDKWSARAEARAKEPTAEALDAAVQEGAGQLILAVRTAPPRDASRPATRPPARRLQTADRGG